MIPSRSMIPSCSFLVAVAGLALVVLTACSGPSTPTGEPSTGEASSEGAPATATTPAVPTAQPIAVPERGACYPLTYDQAIAPTSEVPAVPCREEYTARTFHVGRIQAVLDGHLLAVDSQRVQDAIARACPRRLATWLGTDERGLRLSMFRPVWFSPTLAESDAGADWFRCDAVVVERDQQLLPLTGRLKDALATPRGRERYGLCASARPGDEGSERTVCSQDDSWRAIDVVTFEARRFPGRQRVREAGQAPCEESARTQASDPLSFQWAYEWPSRKQWRDGIRHGICWVPGAQ